jgi:hypothetical protein
MGELAIPNKLFFRIGEVCKLLSLEPYVLRFWEKEFPTLAPTKGANGRRMYRKKDVEMVITIRHLLYTQGLLWTLATNDRVPVKVREEVNRFGLCKDEFEQSGGWPHQLYIREARRMVSDLVLTEHHTFGRAIAPHAVSLGSYGTDTHEIRRIVKDGFVIREGKTATGRGGAPPYPIGYGAIVPKASECENLLVTFALSASHTAFSSIRMEPVFMATNHSAATAAAIAIDDQMSVQQVDQAKLRQRLLANKQVLEWKGAR